MKNSLSDRHYVFRSSEGHPYLCPTGIRAQLLVIVASLIAASSTLAQDLNVPQDKAAIVDRGPHHALWQRKTEHIWPDGRRTTEQHSFVELASGMNHLKDGQWVPSKVEIEILPGFAIARQGQHQVTWAQNLNSEGAIELVTPDGKRLRSHVLGLGYMDASTGNSVLIAEIQDCNGEVRGNEVIYRDAFNGPFKADMRYTYSIGGFEQDVILHEAPPPPEDFGLDSATTRLEVWTEFLSPPAASTQARALRQEADPAKRIKMAMPDLVDESVDFGMMHIGSGQAFPLPKGQARSGSPTVAKSWVRIGGRNFLIEAVEISDVAPLLQGLQQAALQPRRQPAFQMSPANAVRGIARAFPRAPAPARQNGKLMGMAATPLSGPMVVLDYQTLNSSLTNYTFKADTTYYISGAVNLYGTNNHLEGGTVIKFAKNAGATIDVKGVLIGDTDLYRPSVLTASDDSTVGESVTFGALSGGYATTALNFDFATSGQLASLQNLRILNAVTAVRFNGGLGHEIRHLQLVNCGIGVKADNARYAIRNVLGWNLTNALTGSSSTGVWEHATLDGITNLITSITGIFTNSILVGVVNTNGLGGAGNVVLGDSSGVFNVVGGGRHYLAAGSAYRDIGVTNINPALAADLKLRTTYSPFVLTNITGNTTLSPQAARDLNLPDAGFHYPPLDYWVSGVTVSSNVTVQAIGGAALGVDLGTNSWGLILNNAKFISAGDPLKLNYTIRAHMAQEQSSGNLGSRAFFYDVMGSAGSRDSEVRLRHTEFAQLANDGYMLYAGTRFGALEWTHSRVFNPSLVIDMTGSGTLVCGVTNTVFERGGALFGVSGTAGAGVTTHLRNTLWRGAGIAFVGGNTNWTVRDNLFDTLPYMSDYSSPVQNSFNAYFGTTYGLSGGTSNRALTNLTYEIGAFSRYYQPTNSTLANAGSRTADLAGLFHFTSTTNQVKETNSVVDIGPHWLALSNGVPVNTDGDALADYLEDLDGNGVVNSGETSWTDPAPVVSVSSPVNGAIIYAAGSINITLTALATDNGSVTNVEFFNGSNKVGQTNSGSGGNFSITWNSVTSGSYTLTAKAADNLGATMVSGPVNITVDALPSVSLTNPTGGAYFSIAPTNINLGAIASDSDGTVTNVVFYRGTSLLGQSANSPYGITWSNVLAGNYTLTAVATDNLGGSVTSAAVTICVNGALDFGTNKAYVTFGTNGNLGLKRFTLEGWFKRNGTGTTASTGSGGFNAVPLITKGMAENETGRTNMNYFVGIATNVLAADFEEFSNGANHPVYGVTTISNGVWYHMAATYNGTNLQLFLNGGLEAQLAVGADPQYDSIQPAALAVAMTTSNSVSGSLDGVMDEVRIWDYARNQQQIKDGMSREIVSDCGLVARWGLNENQGTTVTNSAGAVINGTITGTGWNWTNSSPFKAGGAALFVVGSTNLSTTDSAISSRLQGLGYVVTVKAATNVFSTNVNGKTLVLISSSVTATNVNTKFTTSAVPVVTWRHDLYDDLGMVVSNTAYYGTTSGVTQLAIMDSAHPLAAGLSNTVTVASNSSAFAWGRPNTNAMQVAAIVGSPTNCTIFGYEKGSLMPGLVAPARRVGLFLSDSNSIATLNSTGWLLFDQAVSWAAATPISPVLDLILTVDDSTSMTNNGAITTAKNIASYFATNLNLTLHRAGLVAFATNAYLRTSLTHDPNAVLAAINNLTGTSNNCNLDRGLNTAQAELVGTNRVVGASQVMVVITRGSANNTNLAIYAAGVAKASSTRVITIGVGTNPNTNLLHAVASCGDEYYVPDLSQLAAILGSITNGLGTDPARFVQVSSLAPSNDVAWTEINIANSNYRTFVVGAVTSTAPVTNLTVVATPNPLVDPVYLPNYWAMNGQRTNRVLLNLTQLSTNIVYCVAKSSAKTNRIIVASAFDSDYDGRSDAQEIIDGTDPLNSTSVLPVLLARFCFNTTNCLGEQGQIPIGCSNILNAASWNGNAVWIAGAEPAILRYRDVESSGAANVNCRNGTVSFWFRPAWQSATYGGPGPGYAARLVEVGAESVDGMYGQWVVCVNSNGTALQLCTQDQGVTASLLNVSIDWPRSQWRHVAVTYSPTNSQLFVDGQLKASGSGVQYYPSAAVRAAQGLRVGMDHNGNCQVGGTIDELKMHNFPLAAQDIAAAFAAESPLVAGDPWFCPNLLPIVLWKTDVDGFSLGQQFLFDDGGGPGNFGWLEWDWPVNTPSVNDLVQSIRFPDSWRYANACGGSSATLIGNPVHGDNGNGSHDVQAAMEAWKNQIVPVAVWDNFGNFNPCPSHASEPFYRISSIALIELVNINNQLEITAKYRGPGCAPNRPPTLDPIGNRTINEDSGQHTVSLTGITSGHPSESQTLTVTATSSDISIIPNPGVNYTSPNNTGTLTFTPALNAFTTVTPVTITVTVDDGQNQDNKIIRTFTVTVNPVNDPPVPSPDTLTASEDTDRVILFSELTANDSVGPANESGQTLTITGVAATSGGTMGTSAATQRGGTVTISGSTVIYRSALNDFSGTPDSFAYRVQDNGTTAGINDFKSAITTVTVTVSPLPDDPQFAFSPGHMSYVENIGPRVIDSLATLSDPDGPTLGTQAGFSAIIYATLSQNYSWPEDRLSIRNGGTGAGQVSVSGNQVLYEGVSVATYYPLPTPAWLSIYFNPGITLPAIRAVIQNLSYENTSDVPNLAPRTFALRLVDPDGREAYQEKIIDVVPVNDPPALGILGLEFAPLYLNGSFSIAGGASQIALSEDRRTIIVGAPGRIDVLDGTDPNLGELGVIGSIQVSHRDRFAVSRNGRTAYVMVAENLRVLDLSNPASPQLRGSYSFNNSVPAMSVSFDGRFVFLGTSSGVKIIDVTNPDSPGLIGSYSSPGVQGLAVSRDGTALYAKVQGDPDGLRIVNIANPAAPQLRASLTLSGTVQDGSVVLSLDEKKAFVCLGSRGLQVVDVSNQLNPALVGGAVHFAPSFGQSIRDASLSRDGSKLFVADVSNSKVHVVEVSDPTLPVILGSTGTVPVGNQVALAFDELCAMSPGGANGVTTVDASTYRLTLTEDTASQPIGVRVSDIETPVGALGLVGTETAWNPGLIPNQNIALVGSGTNRTMTLRPLPNATGSTRLDLTVTDGDGGTMTKFISVTITPVNDPPVVDAGPDIAIVWPSPGIAYLHGTATDPDGTSPPLTLSWSKVSGPGLSTFTGGSTLDPQVQFSDPGVYLLRLTASDGQFTVSDTVTIDVRENRPPVVDAGPDRRIASGTVAHLNGSVTDDGVDGAIQLITWIQDSGPENVPVANNFAPVTTVTLETPGIYVYRLYGADTTFSVSDTMTIIVGDPNAVTYTFNADFGKGLLHNVNFNEVPDQLQLNKTVKPFPFVYIPCSERGTVVRVDANTSQILGEYATAPGTTAERKGKVWPSRTAVDSKGNLWVANSGDIWKDPTDNQFKGSVTRIGVVIGGTRTDGTLGPDGKYVYSPNGNYLAPPFIYNTCIDRHGATTSDPPDGLIKTSRAIGDIRDWPKSGGGSVSAAEDEAITSYVRVSPTPTGQ